jgi:RimJ/RimL family protein N-acetyltransferase
MTAKDPHTYPRTIDVGPAKVTLRLSEPRDRDAVLAMIRELPEHDLLFLARDMTDPAVVTEWLEETNNTRILAVEGGRVCGYAAIHRSSVPWSTHVADLRVMVAVGDRGHGLGRILTQEAFAWALDAGMEKITAQMTLDQKGAISVFEGLGFRPEALLRDHVRDRSGEKHDLLVLSHDVARFASQHYAYGVAQAFQP